MLVLKMKLKVKLNTDSINYTIYRWIYHII